MALYVVLHHRGDERRPWVNAWIDDDLVEAITTTKEIGARCLKSKARGERVFVHRCGWGGNAPVVSCSAEVEDVDSIDRSTVLVRFREATAVHGEPPITPNEGQNFYEA
jgi:hypothetical protein